MEFNFDEIRCFNNEEVHTVLERLVEEKQFMKVLSTVYPLLPKENIKQRLMSFNPTVKFYRTNLDRFKFLNGLDSHYHIMTEIEYGSTK